MRDLYEVFNDLNLEEEKDLEVMNDLEKQKWKKKLRKEIKKPVKTGRKVAVSAGCLGIAAGLFFTMSDSEVMAKARKAVEDSYRSIAIWIIGTPRENDYVQEVYGKDTANGREVTIVDMIADEDLLQISYKDRDLTIENFEAAGYLDEDMEKRTDSTKYSLDAQLLVDGEIVGEGWINSYSLRFNTNAIDNTFSIYTGDYGCDLSEVEEAELILKERYYPDTEEWRFHLNLQKRNLKNTTREQELDETYTMPDGRIIHIYKYAENEGGRKLYVKTERPEGWDPNEDWSGILDLTGVTDKYRKVKFKHEAGDVYLIDRNIDSDTRSIAITPGVIPLGEPGESLPEDGTPIGESFTIQVNN